MALGASVLHQADQDQGKYNKTPYCKRVCLGNEVMTQLNICRCFLLKRMPRIEIAIWFFRQIFFCKKYIVILVMDPK